MSGSWEDFGPAPADLDPLTSQGKMRTGKYPAVDGAEFPEGWSVTEWHVDFEETPFYEQYTDRVENDRELTALISDYYADRGTGKTTAAVRFARKTDRTEEGLTPEKVTNSAEMFTDAYVQQPKGAALVFDEAEAGVNARKAMTNVNQHLNEKVSMGRVGEKYSFYTMPDINQIDKQVRKLAHYWVLIRRRGRARIYKLENNPFEDETYTKPVCDITWDALPDDDPAFQKLDEQKWDKLEDEQKKHISIREAQERVEKARKEERTEARNDFIKATHSRDLLTESQIGDIVDLSQSQVNRIATKDAEEADA